MVGIRWSQEELNFIKNEYKKQISIRNIAKSLNRSYHSVAKKANRIRLKHPFTLSFFEPILSPSFSYVLGAWYGDRTSPTKLGIFVNDYDFVKYFADCLKYVVKKNLIIHKYGKRYFVQIIDRNFANWISNLSFSELLNFISSNGKENISLFLRGFFDAEGTVICRYVQAGQKSREILDVCKVLLDNLNIKSSIFITKPNGEIEWQLRIENLTSLIRFLNNVGFIIKRKQNKLKSLVKKKISKQYPYAEKYYQMLNFQVKGYKPSEIISRLEISIQTFYNWKSGKKPLLLKNGLTLNDIRKSIGDKVG